MKLLHRPDDCVRFPNLVSGGSESRIHTMERAVEAKICPVVQPSVAAISLLLDRFDRRTAPAGRVQRRFSSAVTDTPYLGSEIKLQPVAGHKKCFPCADDSLFLRFDTRS